MALLGRLSLLERIETRISNERRSQTYRVIIRLITMTEKSTPPTPVVGHLRNQCYAVCAGNLVTFYFQFILHSH